MPLTEKQKALRRKGIGASEIAALAGLSKYSTPMEIFTRKRTGADLEPSLAMELGDLLEEPIAAIYARRTGRWLRRVDTLVHPMRPIAMATPDRAAFAMAPAPGEEPPPLLEAERLVQVKSTTWRMAGEWGQPGSDEVPEDYHAQVTWEMGVSGVHLCDLAVLFDKDRFETFTVPFSSSIFEGLYEIAARFVRDHLETGVPPPADTTERYGEMLAKVYPRETSGELIQADGDLEQLVARFAVLRELRKRIVAQLRLHRNALGLAIGPKAGLSGPFGKVTFKATRPSEKPDWRAVANDALMLAGGLVHRFGAELAPEERSELEARVRGMVLEHTETKEGVRRMLCPRQWPEGWLQMPAWTSAPELAAPPLDEHDEDE